jgi:hypothetical protein
MLGFFLNLLLLFLFVAKLALALPNYTGYSGAPGTDGTCAGYCHGSSGGTIVVEGFPTTYLPGQSYVVKVKHSGGSRISNFNASVRVGTGTATAGTITAGLNTATYNTGQEPNGVHFSSSNRDSGNFTWTAPDPGVGEVRLYLAGMQSSSSSGPNTVITLSASHGTGLNEADTKILSKLSLEIKPNIIDKLLRLKINISNKSQAQLQILEQTGRIVANIKIPDANETTQTINWKPFDKEGKRLSAGVYFASLECKQERLIRKFTIKSR